MGKKPSRFGLSIYLYIIFLLIHSLILGSMSALASENQIQVHSEERWTDAKVNMQGWVMWSDDLFSDFSTGEHPYLRTQWPINHPGKSGYGKCDSMYSEPCAGAQIMEYHPVLEPCSETLQVDCLDAVWAELGPQRIMGKLETLYPKKPTPLKNNAGSIVGDMSYSGEGRGVDDSIPTGTQGSLWRIPGAAHSGGELFFVRPRIKGKALQSGGRIKRQDEMLSAVFEAVSLTKGQFNPPGVVLQSSQVIAASTHNEQSSNTELPIAVGVGLPELCKPGENRREGDIGYACVTESFVFQLDLAQNEEVSEVIFASYGLPANFAINPQCHSDKSLNVVKQNILGKRSATFSVSNIMFGDPCFGSGKYLQVKYKISKLSNLIDQNEARLETEVKTVKENFIWAGNQPDRSGRWGCVANDADSCALRERMPEGMRLGLSIRLRQPVNNWLHGRFANPILESTKVLDKNVAIKEYYLWKLTADAIKVPYISETLSDNARRSICNKVTHPSCWFVSTDDRKFLEFEQALPYISDRADAYVSSWRFVSRPKWSVNSSCPTSELGVTGIVATNATLYNPNPPTFNKASQSLEYRVAALHLTPSGEIFKGKYNLYLDAKYARCLWQTGSSPLSASISITGQSENVATTQMIERFGYIDFRAENFTFSAPTISVKLQPTGVSSAQENPKVSETMEVRGGDSGVRREAQADKATAPKVLSRITISCVKGKVVKKVRAVAPKCPVGFRRK